MRYSRAEAICLRGPGGGLLYILRPAQQEAFRSRGRRLFSSLHADMHSRDDHQAHTIFFRSTGKTETPYAIVHGVRPSGRGKWAFRPRGGGVHVPGLCRRKCVDIAGPARTEQIHSIFHQLPTSIRSIDCSQWHSAFFPSAESCNMVGPLPGECFGTVTSSTVCPHRRRTASGACRYCLGGPVQRTTHVRSAARSGSRAVSSLTYVPKGSLQ